MPYVKSTYGIEIEELTLTLKNVGVTSEIKAWIEGVEIFAVKIILGDAYGIAESLIVYYFALAQVFYRLFDVGIVDKTQNVVIGHASLLLCCYRSRATK